MRNILFLLLFVPFIVKAQDSPYKYFKLENGAVLFESIYEVDSMTADKLKEALINFIPTVRGVNDVHQNSEGITANLNGYIFDKKGADLKWGSTPILLLHPINGNISISIKDFKYRIIISNVLLCTGENMKGTMFYNSSLTSVISKQSGKEFRTGKANVACWRNLEVDLYKSFKLSPLNNEW